MIISPNTVEGILSPVPFMQEPPVSSVWRKKRVKNLQQRFFKCCFGDSSETSLYPSLIIVLLYAHSDSTCFANQADKFVTWIYQTYYLYFLISFLTQITMKILKFV